MTWLTGLQVELAEVLGGAEGDHHHAVPEDVLPCGHLESDLCAGDETVLLDHWVNCLHPAVPEVYPGERDESANVQDRNTSQSMWSLSQFTSLFGHIGLPCEWLNSESYFWSTYVVNFIQSVRSLCDLFDVPSLHEPAFSTFTSLHHFQHFPQWQLMSIIKSATGLLAALHYGPSIAHIIIKAMVYITMFHCEYRWNMSDLTHFKI